MPASKHTKIRLKKPVAPKAPKGLLDPALMFKEGKYEGEYDDDVDFVDGIPQVPSAIPRTSDVVHSVPCTHFLR